MKITHIVISFGLLLSAGNVQAQLPAAATDAWNHLPVVRQPVFKKDTFNIVRYGAVADDVTLNTKSINDAIADCSKKGGGVVLVPEGYWLTGPLVLKSNVNLHLASRAIIQFTKDFNQYPLVEGNYEGERSARNQSPVSGTDLENVAITGNGIIDGNGEAWRMLSKERVTDAQWKKITGSGGIVSDDGRRWYPSAKNKKGNDERSSSVLAPGKTLNDFEDIKDFLRPNLVVLTNCKKILLEGVTFRQSPAWCLHPLMCEDLTLRNVSVYNPDYAQNGDGIDVESCKNVLIEGSNFNCGDDGICIKSGRDEEGRRRGKPTENVIIRNNVVYRAHGGFVVGSEMSGGARNIFVENCSFIGTDKGLRFKTARGRGGVVEKIYIRNIAMKEIVTEAIYFDMYYFTKPPVAGQTAAVPPVGEGTPQFRDIYISNIICDGAGRAIFMRGLPEMRVKSIWLDNVILRANKGADLTEASGITMRGVKLYTDKSGPSMTMVNCDHIFIDGVEYKTTEGGKPLEIK